VLSLAAFVRFCGGICLPLSFFGFCDGQGDLFGYLLLLMNGFSDNGDVDKLNMKY
jgi:hypothetical protein